jgi:hypothetical protein
MLHRLLFRYLTAPVEASLKAAVSPLAPYLRRIALGAGLILVGVILLAPVGFMGILAIFFAVAELPYVVAALWAAFGFAVLSLICIFVGFRLARKPR